MRLYVINLEGTVWYISSWFSGSTLTSSLAVSLILNDSDNNGLMSVCLRNSETDEELVLSNSVSNTVMRQSVGIYNPYGFVDLGMKALYVPVDELSVRFLDYVDFVELMPELSEVSSEVRQYVSSRNDWVTAWGSSGTLVEFRNQRGSFVFSLFQILCYMSDCLAPDGRFYLRSIMPPSFIYIVSFRDAVKANGMLVKAKTLGYNPVGKFMQTRYLRRGKI